MLRLACVLSGRGVALAGALLFSTGQAVHAVCGGTLFALGAAGVGLQGWHAVKRLGAKTRGRFQSCPFLSRGRQKDRAIGKMAAPRIRCGIARRRRQTIRQLTKLFGKNPQASRRHKCRWMPRAGWPWRLLARGRVRR